ncbi:HHHH-motif protein [Variovorax soli]|uniref:HHHH-motif protein n=1 Tax=Variovorax soli TaxID=376815 RepID=UPI00286D0470|nr:HHHH-motif protein [Variovorax soli]
MKTQRFVLSLAIAVCGFASFVPTLASAASYRHGHKVCHYDRHHHHRVCHWVR